MGYSSSAWLGANQRPSDEVLVWESVIKHVHRLLPVSRLPAILLPCVCLGRLPIVQAFDTDRWK